MTITKTILTKPIKIPEVLFYKKPYKSVMHPPQTEFLAFSTTGDKNWGELVVHKTKMQFRNDYKGETLAIDFISTHKKNKGLGATIIDFAKNYSKQIGCNGYIVLKAVSHFSKDNAPHIFYRKQGFTSLDKNFDKNLDSFIKNKQKVNPDIFPEKLMFYPEEKKLSFFEKIKNLFV